MNVIRDYYDQNILSSRINKRRQENILKVLQWELENKKILDVGCAAGLLAKIIKRDNNYIVGLDISPKAIELASKFLDKALILDIENEELPFPEKYFDTIILGEVISHLFLPKKTLLKLKRILKDDGKIIISAPNFLVWSNRFKIFSGSLRYADEFLAKNGVIRFFSCNSLKNLLIKTGFKVVQEEYIIHPLIPYFIGKILPNLFAFQVIFKAKK